MTVDEKAAAALLTEFDAGQVYHDDVPETGSYPMVCYKDLSETPVMHADNKLYGREHIIRVVVATSGNAGVNTLKKRVEQCMTTAGFMWEGTGKIRDGNVYYTSLDFSIGEVEDYE